MKKILFYLLVLNISLGFGQAKRIRDLTEQATRIDTVYMPCDYGLYGANSARKISAKTISPLINELTQSSFILDKDNSVLRHRFSGVEYGTPLRYAVPQAGNLMPATGVVRSTAKVIVDNTGGAGSDSAMYVDDIYQLITDKTEADPLTTSFMPFQSVSGTFPERKISIANLMTKVNSSNLSPGTISNRATDIVPFYTSGNFDKTITIDDIYKIINDLSLLNTGNTQARWANLFIRIQSSSTGTQYKMGFLDAIEDAQDSETVTLTDGTYAFGTLKLVRQGKMVTGVWTWISVSGRGTGITTMTNSLSSDFYPTDNINIINQNRSDHTQVTHLFLEDDGTIKCQINNSNNPGMAIGYITD